LSSVLRQGSSVAFWNAMPTPPRGPSTARPSTAARPADGGTSPATILSTDDLPQPEGPTRAANSPRATSSEQPSTASVPAAPP